MLNSWHFPECLQVSAKPKSLEHAFKILKNNPRKGSHTHAKDRIRKTTHAKDRIRTTTHAKDRMRTFRNLLFIIYDVFEHYLREYKINN